MDDQEIAALVEWYVERMQHLVRLASVTDCRTMLRYIAAVHFENRDRFDAFRSELDDEPDPVNLPN